MSQSLAATVLFLAGTISALGQSDQQRHEGKEHPAIKESAIGIWKENWDDVPAVEISSKLQGDRLAGRAVFYVVDPGTGEVVK
ncbi:MAG TPA: hypothetical protein VE262_06975 [Blastocatellia bacterium]|nr:hypothetical protein [Blastocatellia bacterium]